MVNKGPLQIAGLIVAGIGLIGACAVTGMPQWRVTAFIESNIVVFENQWEGLWMDCIRQANIRMQCRFYYSLLALTPDLQAGRALMCSAVCMSFLAFMIAILGMKCTRCTGDNERIKGIILLVAGIFFIIGGLLVLIPVSWTANNIIRDFYNPLVNVAQKRELGEALYIGWVAALCLIVGGIILCCFCRPREKQYSYTVPSKSATSVPLGGIIRKTSKASSLYSKSQYV